MYLPFYYLYYMGCCDDCLTCDIAFNAVMPLSRASTRGRYSRIVGVTSGTQLNEEREGMVSYHGTVYDTPHYNQPE